jgi:hypothetical protein
MNRYRLSRSPPPEGDRALPRPPSAAPSSYLSPPPPPPAEVTGRSPSDAADGGSSFPASWKEGRGPPLPLRRCTSGSPSPVHTVWVMLAVVLFSGGAAQLQRGSGGALSLVWAPWPRWARAGPDGLVRAGLYSGQAYWWWRRRRDGVLGRRLCGQPLQQGGRSFMGLLGPVGPDGA